MISRRLKRAAPLLALLVFIPLVITRLPINGAPPAPAVQPPTLDNNLAQGRLMQALYQIEAAAAETGWTAKSAQTAASIWDAMGDVTRALPYWELAVSLAPEEEIALRRTAEIYLEFQRWPEAEESLNRLLALTPGDTWVHYHLGVLQIAFDPTRARDHLIAAASDAAYSDVAFELLTAVSITTPDSTSAMEAGLILADHDAWPYAELAFQQAAALGEPYPEALAFLGLARDQQGKDGGDVIERSVALSPTNPQVRYIQGLHLRGEADYAGSLEAFFRAMASDPNSPAYAAELGEAYKLVGDFGIAEEWFKAAVTLSNDDPRFQGLLDAFYASMNVN
jgi:tetratricopeptide (TPR) repeat protein